MMTHASPNVLDIGYFDDEHSRELFIFSIVRNLTLDRLCAIPSYPYKTTAWRNRYYDVIKRKVIKELETKYSITIPA